MTGGKGPKPQIQDRKYPSIPIMDLENYITFKTEPC